MGSLRRRRLWVVAAGILALVVAGAVGRAGTDADHSQAKEKEKKGSDAWTRGDLDTAIDVYRDLERQTAGDGDRYRAHVLNELAELFRTVGLYQDAEPRYQESRALYDKQYEADHQYIEGVAYVLHNLGALYVAEGRYPAAQEVYEKSVAILAEKFGSDHVTVAICQIDLAELYRRTGRYDEALQLFQGSLDVLAHTRPRESLREARARNSLGALYKQLRRYYEAQQALEESLALYNNLDHREAGMCEANLGWLYFARGEPGDLQRAEIHFQSSLTILTKKLGPQHPSVAGAQSNLGWLYLTVGRCDDALPLFQSSLKIRTDKLPADHPDLALGRSNLALLLGAQGKWNEAAAEMDRARQTLGRHVSHMLPYLSEADQLAFLEAQDDFQGVQEQLYAALSLGFTRREDARIAELSAEWLLNGKALAHEVLAQRVLLARYNGDARVQELAEVRTQVASLTLLNAAPKQLEQYKKREADLSREIGEANGKQVGERPWVKLNDVRARLPRNSVLIEIAKFDLWDFQARQAQRPVQALRYAAWLIPASGEGRVQVVDLGPASRIDAAVDAVRTAVDAFPDQLKTAREPELEGRLQEPLGRLARLVYQPLEQFIGPKERRWVISPDGKLWLVSWAMLPVTEKRYAIEEHTISYVVSGRDLLRADPQRQPGRSLVIADPDFDLAPGDAGAQVKELLGDRAGSPALDLRGGTRSFEALRNKFEPLPGTEKDADAAVEGLTRLTGESPVQRRRKQALEQVFKATRNPRFLVLSTHGWVLDQPQGAPVNPLLLCGMALAGANKRGQAQSTDEDGILTGLEITGADLRGTELVILSACESGLGTVRDGEGVAGLRQAFQLAGSRTVVATLWEISDDVTPLLIRYYFSALVQSRGKADALRQAQRTLIESRRTNYGAAHPFFWAAFTSTGQAD